MLCLVLASAGVQAQTLRAWDGGAPGNNNWISDANWEDDLLPSGAFDEVAVIDNGDTVVINTDLATALDGPPGALVATNNSTLEVTGAGRFLVDTSGGSVDGSATFSGGATLSLTGGSTSFDAESISFAGGGVYNPHFTGPTHGLLSTPGVLTVGGGTLLPEFDFAAGPQSWLLADAGDIAGEFVLDASSVELAPGQSLTTSVAPGGNGEQLFLTLSNVLVLSVNADTGVTQISNPAGGSTTITAYSVGSPSGGLNPASWDSLESQLGGGWNVAGTPSTGRLEELAGPVPPSNSTQDGLTVGAVSQGIGAVLTPLTAFQATPDLTFEYVTASGELAQGIVEYTGLNAVNNLLLTVDPTSGQAELKNSSLTPIELTGYSIISGSGSLKPGNGDWNSLADQGVMGVDEANATSGFLSELIPDLGDTLLLAPGATYAMGDLFSTTGDRDLRLEFVRRVTSLAGDYNNDGSVDAADYTVWRDGLGTTYSEADYDVWKDNYGATAGAPQSVVSAGTVRYGTVPTATATAVPEPGGVLLTLAVGGLLVLSLDRRGPQFAAARVTQY